MTIEAVKARMRVVARFQLEGFHRWPEAPESERHLRGVHRHLFHFRVEAKVEGDNREIEVLELRRRAYAVAGGKERPAFMPVDYGTSSCEQLAGWLLLELPELCLVEVLEDGENGAVVERA